MRSTLFASSLSFIALVAALGCSGKLDVGDGAPAPSGKPASSEPTPNGDQPSAAVAPSGSSLPQSTCLALGDKPTVLSSDGNVAGFQTSGAELFLYGGSTPNSSLVLLGIGDRRRETLLAKTTPEVVGWTFAADDRLLAYTTGEQVPNEESYTTEIRALFVRPHTSGQTTQVPLPTGFDRLKSVTVRAGRVYFEALPADTNAARFGKVVMFRYDGASTKEIAEYEYNAVPFVGESALYTVSTPAGGKATTLRRTPYDGSPATVRDYDGDLRLYGVDGDRLYFTQASNDLKSMREDTSDERVVAAGITGELAFGTNDVFIKPAMGLAIYRVAKTGGVVKVAVQEQATVTDSPTLGAMRTDACNLYWAVPATGEIKGMKIN